MTVNIPEDPISFRALLAPVGADTFFGDYWRRRALNLLPPESERNQVAAEVGALDISRLAGMAQGGVQAWMSNEQVLHSVIPVDAPTAAKALSIGATLYFIDLPLNRLKKGMAAFIGVDARNINASIFLTPAGGGTSWHFDANENFTMQLTGTKRWEVGEAPAVEAAPESYILGLRVPESLAGLVDDVKTEPAQAIDMVPGMFLYVPRGVLHRTVTHEISWSLNLSYRE